MAAFATTLLTLAFLWLTGQLDNKSGKGQIFAGIVFVVLWATITYLGFKGW